MGAYNANNGGLGNIPMPNHGPNGVGGRMPDDHDDTNNEARLNAYIYSYFCGKGKWDLARALKDSGLDFEPPLLNDNANGANDNMQTDSKDGIDLKRPDDLPVPDVGLVDAQGGSFLSSWFALFAPKGTPPDITNRLNAEARKALEGDDLKRRFAELGGEIKLMTPPELMAYVRAEHAKWAQVVKTSGARLD